MVLSPTAQVYENFVYKTMTQAHAQETLDSRLFHLKM